jgi:hypothetical protein
MHLVTLQVDQHTNSYEHLACICVVLHVLIRRLQPMATRRRALGLD